jgi:hypothetical protein
MNKPMMERDLPEERLVALARQLGAEAAERIDPERTAVAVLARLREQPEVRHFWQPAWLALAASLALLVGAGAVLRQVEQRGALASGAAPVAAVDVSGLSAHQLGEVLQGLDQPDLNVLDEDAPPTIESGIEELTPAQLRSLLNSLTS